ncbi:MULTISPECIES: autotransporter assembly complex family protein [unclassified Vibrio]|uniref:Translocation and assembly module subunit TamA n=1 Tax=Vibrio sp. HB236076 TaxID=3232307 RepID=A0AB39HGW5_9VIBR|nr:autotransporter assembly complex family protein [Vibrio sp. HB161653]MDP5255591.1 autotransporter assembly complex family protein [Vibrio sp. HB161653]
MKAVIFSVALLSLVSLPTWAKVDFELAGVSGDIEKNIQAHLAAIKESEYNTSLRFRSRLTSSIEDALNALGYYQAEIEYQISDDNSELTAQIQLGEPVLITTLDIVLTGEAENDEDFQTLLSETDLKVGQRLNHQDYQSLKSSLQSLAVQKGYFDAKFTQSKLAVSVKKNQAYIHLHYSSGIRYHFGQVSLSGSQIVDEKVFSLMPFKEGDPYDVNQLGLFNHNLSNTNWFSSIFVEPKLDNLGQQRDLPIDVNLAPQSQNQLETGLGYSTDVGVRGSLTWKKPWVTETGHSFSSSISLSDPEQAVTASYKIPLEDVLHRYYRIAYGLKHVDYEDTKSLESNLAFEHHWHPDQGWNRTLFVRYLVEDYEQADQDDIGHFVLPGVTFSRTRTKSDAGRMPLWGDKQSVTLEYGDSALFSETRVLRLQATTKWIRSIGQNHRGIVRLEGGANLTDEFTKLSPSLRFFAGGDNSIRGYDYESISPTDDDDDLIGGKFLATSTLEYQYRLTGNWWLATFYDYGDAFTDTPDWNRGVGTGIRWASPIGPVRLDFAWGLDSDPGDRFNIHFSLGPDL